MKNKMYLLFIVLSLLAVIFSGCNRNGGDADQPDFVYVPTYTKLPEKMDSVNYTAFYNDVLYFIGYGVVGTVPYTEEEIANMKEWGGYDGTTTYEKYGEFLYKMNLSDKSFTKMEGYSSTPIPDGTNGYSNINGITTDSNGKLWLMETVNSYKSNSDGTIQEESNSFYLHQIGEDGTIISTFNLSDLAENSTNYFYVNKIIAGNDGHIYLCSENTIYAINTENGQCAFTLTVSNWISGMIKLADGRIGVGSYENGHMTIKTINASAKEFDKNSFTQTYNVNFFYDGGGDYDFYYSDGNNLYGYSIAQKAETKLLNWLNIDIDSSNLQGITPLSDGRILCMVNDYSNESTQTDIITLTKTAASAVQKKTIITMAALYMDYNIRSEIIKFNKSNPDYRIELTDYSEFNTENDYNAGLLKLNTELISGKVPDILYTSNLPVQQYIARGLLEDLYPYIDKDTDLGGRENMMQPVLKALEYKGGLYQINPGFGIFTVIGRSDVVGPDPGWTLDDLNALMEKHPNVQPFAMADKNTILYYSCMMDMGNYINWETGECNFDSDGFIKLLEFANSFPSQLPEFDENNPESYDEYSLIQNGKALLAIFYGNDFESFQMYEALFGGDITFKGFPTEKGNGSVFNFDSGLAMSSKCKHKDAAWSFIRLMLTEDYQKNQNWGRFPTNKTVFDQKVKEAMTEDTYTDENGNVIVQPKGTWGWSTGEIDMYAMTEAQYQKIMELIENTTETFAYDQNMMDIITEEAAPFFAGDKTAADTAKGIQSRINIYVNEQL